MVDLPENALETNIYRSCFSDSQVWTQRQKHRLWVGNSTPCPSSNPSRTIICSVMHCVSTWPSTGLT